MKSRRNQSGVRASWLRHVAVALIPIFLFTSTQAQVWQATFTGAPPSVARRPLPPRVSAAARSHRPVDVNRAQPQVAAPPLEPMFSAQPTEAEIRRAHVFDEPLIPMGRPTTAKENKALTKALRAYLESAGREDFSAVTGFLARYP